MQTNYTQDLFIQGIAREKTETEPKLLFEKKKRMKKVVVSSSKEH